MFLFVVYAVLVWYLACRWRREWRGLGVVALGLAGVGLVAIVHYKLHVWTEGRVYLPVMQMLLYPYGLLVAGFGLFIWALPRTFSSRGRELCRSCGYDVTGLAEEARYACPECGNEHAHEHTGPACAACGERLPELSPAGKCRCSRCRTLHISPALALAATQRRPAQSERHHGQARDQGQPDGLPRRAQFALAPDHRAPADLGALRDPVFEAREPEQAALEERAVGRVGVDRPPVDAHLARGNAVGEPARAQRARSAQDHEPLTARLLAAGISLERQAERDAGV